MASSRLPVRAAALVAANGGAITLTGTSVSTSTSNTGDAGVDVYLGTVSNTGTGTITITGTGGPGSGGVGASGVSIGGTVTVVNGMLTITGTGGAANFSNGVAIATDAMITSTGTGNIIITGTPGTVGGASDAGDITLISDTLWFTVAVNFQTNGNITVKPLTPAATIGVGAGAGTLSWTDTYLGYLDWGTAAAGKSLTIGDINSGNITINTASTILNKNVNFITGGNISLITTALAHAGANASTLGMYAEGNITISSAITAAGSALNVWLQSDYDGDSDGYINIGIFAQINSNNGNITMGGGSGNITAGTLNADGTVNVAATGFAVGNAGQASGIGFGAQGAVISAGSGNIIMNGQGFNTTTDNNYGIAISSDNYLSTTSGNISLTGVGGGGAGNSGLNYGLGGSNSTTITGTISLTGTGGGAGAGAGNSGIYGGSVSVTGAGAIIMNGTKGVGAGGGCCGSQGIAQITTTAASTGTITMFSNDIIYGGNSGFGTSVVNGALSITGLSGIAFENDAYVTSTGSGPITLNGGTGGIAISPNVSTINIGGGSTTGDITMIGDTVALGANTTIQTTGNIIVRPYTITTTVGLNGSAGTLNLNATEMGYFSANTLIISRNDGQGLMRVAGADLSAENYHLSLLNGSANIQFDGGVTDFTMPNNKNFSATTTSGDIIDSANGTIQTQGSGTITLDSGRDVSFTQDFDLTSATGTILVKAKRDIIESGSGDITTSNAAITLNADSDANSAGAISLSSGTAITSNGGNITLGGGADPTTTAAYGNAANPRGILINGATVSSGAGNILMRGEAWSNAATADLNGIWITGGSGMQSTTGSITMYGQGGAGNAAGALFGNNGISIHGGSSTISTVNGTITLNGTGGSGDSNNNAGVAISSTGQIVSTVNGAIIINGTSGTSGNNYSYGVGIQDTTGISTVAGNVTITGINANSGFTSQFNAGIGSFQSAIVSTGSGVITLIGTGSNGGNDVHLNDFDIGGGSATGNITLNANTISGPAMGPFAAQTTGNVTFAQRTAATTVGINGAAGTLQIDDDILDNVTAANTIIGRNDGTGLMRIAGTDLSGTGIGNLSLLNGSGNIQFDGGALTLANNKSFSEDATSGAFVTSANGSITTTGTGDITIADATTLGGNLTLTSADTITFSSTINGAHNLTATADTFSLGGNIGGSTPLAAVSITSANGMTLPSISANSIFARTTGATDITIGAGKTLTASGAGNALVLASGRNFINLSNAGALSAPSGNWVIFSNLNSDDTPNGLSPLTLIYSQAYPDFTGVNGNSWIFQAADTGGGFIPGGSSGGGSSLLSSANSIWLQADDLLNPPDFLIFDLWRLYYEWTRAPGGTIIVPKVRYMVAETHPADDKSPDVADIETDEKNAGGPYLPVTESPPVTMRCAYISNLSVRGAPKGTPPLISICNQQE